MVSNTEVCGLNMKWNHLLKICREYGLIVQPHYSSYSRRTEVMINKDYSVFRKVQMSKNDDIDFVYWDNANEKSKTLGKQIQLYKYSSKQIREMIEVSISNAKRVIEEKMLEDAKKDF